MIWLIGAQGMLGSEVARQLKENGLKFVATDREVDITDLAALREFANNFEGKDDSLKLSITWIINCAAYTAVDQAEEHQILAEKLNVQGPKNIALLAREIGAKMIHISTDYVFNGTATKPYSESDPLQPLGVYGETKALGEKAIQDNLTEYYILRTAWLYGYDGPNFVYTMLRLMKNREQLKVVADQKGTPTCAVDLAQIINCFLRKEDIPYGIYHFTNLGEISWFNFAQEIYANAQKLNLLSQNCEILPCTSADFPTKAKRPAYSVLDKTKIQEALEIILPQWDESLAQFMKNPLFKKEN